MKEIPYYTNKTEPEPQRVGMNVLRDGFTSTFNGSTYCVLMIYVLHIWNLQDNVLVQYLQELPYSIQNVCYIFEGYYSGWLIFQNLPRNQ